MSGIVLVTGATSGIGEATARIFAKNGYDLILTGRRHMRLARLQKEFEGLGIKVWTLCFDIRQKDDTESAIDNLPDEWKEIDILVNNAGLASGLNPVQDGDVDDWEKMIDTNIKGLLYISRKVSKLMEARKSGHIINVGSVAGKFAYPNGNVYSATKYAVNSLSQGMRIDLVKHGIRVSQVSPGLVETEFSEVRFHGDKERAKDVYNWLDPLKGEDIADAIYWMATRPAHVNINDIWIMPTAQASPAYTEKNT
jgi:NADP-dependent 3-hydroxy acid dehydrogenase YdfG